MTQDEIIEMARQAELDWHTGWVLNVEQPNRFEIFAKLVSAKERKEICGTVQQIVPITSWAHELLDAIRARGEA